MLALRIRRFHMARCDDLQTNLEDAAGGGLLTFLKRWSVVPRASDCAGRPFGLGLIMPYIFAHRYFQLPRERLQAARGIEE